jgi:undecaprenyl-diphosphatase
MGAAMLVFSLLAYRIREHRPPSWDSQILRFLSPHRLGQPARSTLDLLDDIVGEYQGLVFAGLLIADLLARRRVRAALVCGLALVAALATVAALKPAFHRPPLIADLEGYFPSMHAAGSLVVGVTLVRLIWPTPWRWPVLVVSLALVGLYGAALVYSRSHYPSDVLAGWCIALFWTCGFALLSYRPRSREVA